MSYSDFDMINAWENEYHGDNTEITFCDLIGNAMAVSEIDDFNINSDGQHHQSTSSLMSNNLNQFANENIVCPATADRYIISSDSHHQTTSSSERPKAARLTKKKAAQQNMSPIAYEMRRKFMQRERQRRCRDKRKNQSTRLKSCANDFGVLLEENKNLKKRVEQLDRRINIIKATINNPE